MASKEDLVLKDLELRLSKLRHSHEQFLPIFHQLHRKVLSLDAEIKHLEQKRLELTQGQLVFDSNF